MVTFTWRTSLKTEPSFMRAIATTFWVSARRMRVLASATLDGEKWKLMTPGFGLPSATIITSSTKLSSVIGTSTLTVIGTVLPFSAISGSSSLTFPLTGSLPRVNALMASSLLFLAARAGPARRDSVAARTAPVPRARAWRRFIAFLIGSGSRVTSGLDHLRVVR